MNTFNFYLNYRSYSAEPQILREINVEDKKWLDFSILDRLWCIFVFLLQNTVSIQQLY